MYTVHVWGRIPCLYSCLHHVAACIYITILLVIFTQALLANRCKKKKTLFIKPRIEIQKDVQNYCPLMLFQNILDVIAAPV